MIYRLDKLVGMAIHATDGEAGKIRDAYFDDRRWTVRYVVVDTGSWLDERKVLISPFAVEGIDWKEHRVQVRQSRAQVRDSPPFDTDLPVSRQYETEYFRYYGYPEYWTSGALPWGTTATSMLPLIGIPPILDSRADHLETEGDEHLRSAAELAGYKLQARDHPIGHLEDFLIDEETWEIRYLVIDTHNWWPGRHVVIPPQWITGLDWAEQSLDLDVTRDAVQQAPEYDPSLEFKRKDEAGLYRHYARPEYWPGPGPD